MIVGIHHVAIGVPDLDAGVTFYTEAFGFEVVQRHSWDADSPEAERAIGLPGSAAAMAMLKGPNAFLELWQYTRPAPRDLVANPNDLGYPHFALQVDDIQQEYDRLTNCGMTFVADQPVDFGASAAVYGRDPFGNVIEIYEIRDPSIAQLPRSEK